jgi:MerR family Zn(II)-responsive transcriptional regulator of zntA
MRDVMTRGELALRCGVHPETIRFYERMGILPPAPRSESGYRLFDETAATRVLFVKRAQAAGFALDEIKSLLALYGAPDATCGDVQAHVIEKLAEIERRIYALNAMRDWLLTLTAECPGGVRPVDECPILETFAAHGEVSLSVTRPES